MTITELLGFAVKNDVSDIHLSSTLVPRLRIHGELMVLHSKETAAPLLQELYSNFLTLEQKACLDQHQEIDFSLAINDVRFRVHIFSHQGGMAAVLRVISNDIPTFTQLGLPQVLESFTTLNQGLVLITGQTGMGKSTTLASMIEHINQRQPRHIVTLEDPIEYLFHSKQSLIHQRQIFLHTATTSAALRACLREDPDVIVIGEMRDLDTIRLALTAAETGHLVMATLHTSSAIQTVHRLLGMFPSHERQLLKLQFAESLQAIVSQVLIPASSQGRIAACEILIATRAVKNLIREDKSSQIYSIMQMERQKGMQTLDQDLERLIHYKKISVEQALIYAQEREACFAKWKNFLH